MPDSAPRPCPDGCQGGRPGYQWHQRTGHLPACEASAEAARTYMRDYYQRTGGWTARVRRQRLRTRTGR